MKIKVMRRFIWFMSLLVAMVHNKLIYNTCLIETTRVAKSCPKTFEFSHNGQCRPMMWPDWNNEYWCRGHAEESCVKYVYLEKWNEKNEWVKYRQVQNAPVN